MRPQIVRSFLVIRPNGKRLVVNEWQDYHKVPGVSPGGSATWEKDPTTAMRTEDGREVLQRESDLRLWIPSTGEILDWPKG